MRNVLLVLMILVLLVASCASKNAEEKNVLTPDMRIVAKEKAEVKQPVILTENDNRRALALEKGQRFTIELEENPTTGYMWKLKEEKLPNVVKLVDSRYEPYSTEPTRIGAGGKRYFNFEAVEYGNGMVKLVYCRPWQCEASIAKEFSISANVEEPRGE